MQGIVHEQEAGHTHNQDCFVLILFNVFFLPHSQKSFYLVVMETVFEQACSLPL